MAKTKSATKAFISYSRKDTDFARRLHARLGEDGLDLWADWERIPITANWMAEITGAIEQADSFIFIISPDSLVSEYCIKELRIAVENNKRMVPVLHRMPRRPQMKTLPHELSAHQWVYIRPEDDFEQSVGNMLAALTTDLEWVKAHTRLQERALEWNRKSRDVSFLLRGSDLEQAEAWLGSASAERKPSPTRLQTEFILASRQQETARQRSLFFATAVGLALTAVLAVAALFAWREAEQQARIALSRQLAAQSLNNLESNPAVAMLLSVQAFQVRDDLESRTSLLTALAENPSLVTFLHDHEATVFAVAYDPLGRWLASGGGSNELYLWDLQTRRPYARLASALGGEIRDMAASPDGALLAVGDANGFVEVWNLDAQEYVTNVFAHTGGVSRLAFTPDGQALVSAGADGRILFWDTVAYQPSEAAQQHGAPALGLALSPDGRWMATGAQNGELFLWDLRTRKVVSALSDHANEVNVLAFAPDGTRLYSAGRDTFVRGWSIPAGDLLFKLTGHRSNVRALAVSPDGAWLATGGEDQTALLWSLAETPPRLFNQFSAHTNWVNDLAFSPDSRQLASASFDTNIILWQTTSSGTGRYQRHTAPVRRVVFRPTGALVVSGGQDNAIIFWDRLSGTPLLAPIDTGGSVFGLDLSADGSRLVTGNTAGALQVWDAASGARLAEYVEPGAQFFTVALSPDGRTVAAGGITPNNALLLWDLETGSTRWLSGHAQFIRWAAFRPDGRLLITAGWDGNLILWDVQTATELRRFIPHPLEEELDPGEQPTGANVLYAAFSADGRFFVTTSSDHTARVWKLEEVVDSVTKAVSIRDILLVYTLEGHSDWVHGAAFSPDGARLVTVSEDKTIFIWDLADGSVVARLTGHEASVNTVAFSPDGKLIATGSSDNDLFLWSVDFTSAPQLLCLRVNRDFTETEWTQYLGGVLAYEQTCAAYLP
ncbi:MAG: TIR domain-containing protein [Chloroflexi bacterium]|nr:TIR domain-containing protein [Chloroflexota bacterium]